MIKNIIAKRVKSEQGQAMVEFALVLPLLLAILCGIIDFGWLFYNQLNVDDASRIAARSICVDCKTKTYEEVRSAAEEIVEANIRDPETLQDPGVIVRFYDSSGTELSNTEGHKAAMVAVQVKTDMPVLTFVLHAIVRGDTREVSASTTYKTEARIQESSTSTP